MKAIINHAQQLLVAAACVVFISGSATAAIFENPDLLGGIGDFEEATTGAPGWTECCSAGLANCHTGAGYGSNCVPGWTVTANAVDAVTVSSPRHAP